MPFVTFSPRTEYPEESGLERGLRSAAATGETMASVQRQQALTGLAQERVAAVQDERAQRKALEAGLEQAALFRARARRDMLQGAPSFLQDEEEWAGYEKALSAAPPQQREAMLGLIEQGKQAEIDQWHKQRLAEKARGLGLIPGSLAPEGQTVTGQDGQEVDAQDYTVQRVMEGIEMDPAGTEAWLDEKVEEQRDLRRKDNIRQTTAESVLTAMGDWKSLMDSDPRLFDQLFSMFDAWATDPAAGASVEDYLEAAQEFKAEMIALRWGVPTVSQFELEGQKGLSRALQDLAARHKLENPEDAEAFGRAAEVLERAFLEGGVGPLRDGGDIFSGLRRGLQGAVAGAKETAQKEPAKPADVKKARPQMAQIVRDAGTLPEATRQVNEFLQGEFGMSFRDLPQDQQEWFAKLWAQIEDEQAEAEKKSKAKKKSRMLSGMSAAAENIDYDDI